MMRFMVDECTGPLVADWLKKLGHDVFSIFDSARGMEDDEIIRRATDENRIIITNDKDFGEKIFKDGRFHNGIILLRLQDERSRSKIEVLSSLLNSHSDNISGAFVVVTEKAIRFARL